MGRGMNELALFAGGGGGLLGTKTLGFRPVCYVEWNRYAADILQARIKDGCLEAAPIWDDVRTFDGRAWAGKVDIVTGGFPCQPFSNAGKGLGESDPRNMWPATIRIIRMVRPRWLLLENVPGLISKPYWRTILGELSEAGFSAEWGCLSAAAVGAPHIRERVWIVGYAERGRCGRDYGRGAAQQPAGRCKDVAYAEGFSRRLYARSREPGQASSDSERSSKVVADSAEFGWKAGQRPQPTAAGGNWWAVEPELGRVAHGVANRVDRLTAIGNGQVPAVVRAAWLLLKERLMSK